MNYDPNNFTQAELDQLYQAGMSDQQIKELQDQRKAAQAVRSDAANFSPTVQAGRTVVPNLLGALQNGMARRDTDKTIADTSGKIQDAITGTAKARQLYFQGPKSDQTGITPPPPMTPADLPTPQVDIQPPPQINPQQAIAASIRGKKPTPGRQMTPEEFLAYMQQGGQP